jgi:hypothetical protein
VEGAISENRFHEKEKENTKKTRAAHFETVLVKTGMQS